MNYELTDTFGGEANYCWVKRGTVDADDLFVALRKARKELGLTGVRGDIKMKSCDCVHWVPRNSATVLIVSIDY